MKHIYLLTLRWSTMTIFLAFSSALFATDVSECEDDVAWGIYCPDDVHLPCGASVYDLSSYGHAYVHDYSGTHYIYNPTVEHHLSSCNTGYITRTWSAYNPYAGTYHSCSQTIYVGGGSQGGFGYHDIHWPAATVHLEGCNPSIDPYSGDSLLAPPTFDHVQCSHVGIAYNDVVFTVNSTCRKIIRTWKVADWCQHDPYTGAGSWTFDQTIKIMNSDPPVYTCPDDVTVSSDNCHDAFVHIPALEVDASSCGGYYSVSHNSPYADAPGNDLSGTYPVGTTKVKFIINYGCGYKRNCHIDITVRKDKPPTPYCLHTIATALMPVDTDGDQVIDDGMVEIWAEDLDRGSTANCGAGPLEFSFSSDVTDKSRMFTCAQAGRNPVQIWVTDRYGNQDWCLAYVIVQNNGANIPDCEPLNYTNHPATPLALQGRVLLPNGSPVQEATLRLVDMGVWLPKYEERIASIVVTDTIVAPNGTVTYVQRIEETIEIVQVRPTDHPSYELSIDAAGLYERDSIMAIHNDYMLHTAAVADGRPVIDLHDAHRLMSHIIGTEVFTTPYEYIAADINQDQNIDIRDFVLLYNHVSQGATLSIVQPWVVVDGAHVWASPSEALAYCPDEVMINTEDDHVMGQDWYAVRVGDLTDRVRTFTAEQPTLGHAVNDAQASGSIDPATAQQLRSIINAKLSGVEVFPNPFADEITVRCDVDYAQEVQVVLYTADGRMIHTSRHAVSEGLQEVRVDIASSYRGMLLYEITHDTQTYTGRLLKQ